MKKNTSPWLYQLDPSRTTQTLTGDIQTDVVVVGAGIAGVASAFYILKNTEKKVTVVERFKLAHGATGHNAGQIVSYFERGFASLVEEFGVSLAKEGQQAVEGAWQLLDEMYTDAKLDIPLSRFLGHAGLISIEQILWHLENNRLRKESGLATEQIRISDEVAVTDTIPELYAGLYTTIPKKEVLSLLETEVPTYLAVLSYQKGCLNSALFCQEVLSYLQEHYADRFALYEHTPIHKVILRKDAALLDAHTHTIEAARVVLCTNGFENIHILNETGLDIDAKYHHLISGKVGYMSGYLEKMDKQPIAISYFTDPAAGGENSYYYLTRRPYEYEKDTKHNLISVGGPDMDLSETSPYSQEDAYPEEMGEKIDMFLRATYSLDKNKKIEYAFTWHGLMGYTKNGIRLIGPEPQNPVLLYNLGCNGVGILHSLYGGKKIAAHIGGDTLEKSIFDIPPKGE